MNASGQSTTVAAPLRDGPACPDESALIAAVRAMLERIPDPEVPVVSIVELGIVRDVRVKAGAVIVSLTPTYSGCPAIDAIGRSVIEVLSASNIAATIETRLAPAWTTDWITQDARRKLASFGIAPPITPGPRIDVSGISPLRRRNVTVACPRCGSSRTRLISQFGSTACKAQYRCDACLEPFDYFKHH